MGTGKGLTIKQLMDKQSDSVSDQEATLTAEQQMKKDLLEKERLRLLRRRPGGLLKSSTDTGGKFLGS